MPSPPAALSSRLVRQALNIAAEHGVPVEELCREVGLHLADLDDPELRIPYTVLDTFLERAVEITGDDNLGLHMARMSEVDPDDAAGLIILTSATLKESMVRGCRYQRVWGDGERFLVEETERGVRMRFTPVGPWRPAHRHMVEVAMVQLAMGARFFTGADVRPLLVRFVHRAPADIREHEALFGCPLIFGAPHSDIEFSREDAERPFVHADALLSAMFEKQAQRVLAKLPVNASLTERVREQVRRTLAGGDFSFEAVARALHMPQRTLQRKLAEEEQSYASILESVRRELSQDYLRRRMSIAEVSFLLGYGEPATFHRAFKRWWGMSPEAFRRARAPSPSGPGPG
ncbi:AraC family transcriptional regulator ligand-binding domain-containing protein [Vitiosangium sp. GDMCC 1.1324]|uniref:AraC family transcriptional regulator ligand-binding domain-containing protein n=1 Tax=Vitiosangium sp. (strain GDMCC 1.1324) TaxID=2138576 RepID=UPI000D3AE8A9|nr:AraC family transcriptional regulator ligand-binding domain-containing protein [Vitiosangium sp. GDMCC 1.1324]PTL83460.1 AraC family transcriptional regulator [Vitiosangium sp. GDMCC 1.1324]